jgi:cytochrome P450
MANSGLLDVVLTTPISVPLTALFAWLAIKVYKFGDRESYLPPGPPTTPFFGNLLDIPKQGPQYKFTEWAKQYGGIYSVKMADKTVVILTSFETVHDILEKNSAASSDRPNFHLIRMVEGDENLNLALAHYNDRWRSLRRAAQQVLSPQACRSHLPVQQAEGIQLAYDLMTDHKTEVQQHLRRFSTSVIMSVMFGVRIPRTSTRAFVDFWNVMEKYIYLTAPTTHPPMDIFPILKYLPERFASWKRECREVRAEKRAHLSRVIKPVEERLAKGEENGSFMEVIYQRAKEWNLDEEAVLYLGSVMIEGGSDTTSVVFQNFVTIMAAYPEIQKKAQEEIDRVIGPDRMPELDDYEDLPYVQALVNEVHRFRTVSTLSAPHAATEDIVYGDYVIPKGTAIYQNSWGLFHDETIWENPSQFNPDRFIKNPELAKYAEYAFGCGRRVCVGIHLAKSSISINVMNILWGFNVTKATDDHGNTIEPNLTDYHDGLVNNPKEVKCTLKPRDAHHEAVLRQTFLASAESFEPFERDLSKDDKAYVDEVRRKAAQLAL